jgi:hypothetical protein
VLIVLFSPGPLDLVECVVEVVLELTQVFQLSDIIGDLLLVGTFEFSPKRKIIYS